MDTYAAKDVTIKVDGNQIASLPEAVINISLGRIEVVIDDVLLTEKTIGILSLTASDGLKEFEVRAKADGKTLRIEKAIVENLTFDAERGEAIHLKNISFLGLRATWEIEE
jgi:hypothetical protein